MSKKKLVEWIIPVEVTQHGHVFLKAVDAETALDLVKSGKWETFIENELTDWRSTGRPERDE